MSSNAAAFVHDRTADDFIEGDGGVYNIGISGGRGFMMNGRIGVRGLPSAL